MMPFLLIMNRLNSTRHGENLQGIECCRTCLRSENLTDIFHSKNFMIKRMQQLKITTGLTIKYNDGLSQKICIQCLDMMEDALKFRRISLKAQESLLEMKKYKQSDVNNHNLVNIKIEKGSDIQKPKEIRFNTVKKVKLRKNVKQNTQVINQKSRILKQYKLKKVKKNQVTIPNADSYTCPVCEMVFTIKPSYAQHLRFHYNPCVCELCGLAFRSKSTLEAHKRAKHGLEKIYNCDQCQKGFAYREAYRIHIRTHTGEKPYICDQCGASFHRRGTFVQHLGVHNPENTVQCELCPTRVKSLIFLRLHKSKVHSGRHYRYICPICDRQFRYRTILKTHAWDKHQVAASDLGTICELCPTRVKSIKFLHAHKNRVHSGKRYRYICPICDRQFPLPTKVKKHAWEEHQVVEGDLGAICDLCPTRVKSIQFLYSHKNAVHSGKRYRYICPICDRQYQKRMRVKKHAWEVHQVAEADLGTIVRINTYGETDTSQRLNQKCSQDTDADDG